MLKLSLILSAPDLPGNLPYTAKWLSGEGAGSWFVIEEVENNQYYKICRFSPEGNFECEGIFKTDKRIDIKKSYSLTYPSHCSKVTVMQGIEKIHMSILE